MIFTFKIYDVQILQTPPPCCTTNFFLFYCQKVRQKLILNCGEQLRTQPRVKECTFAGIVHFLMIENYAN